MERGSGRHTTDKSNEADNWYIGIGGDGNAARPGPDNPTSLDGTEGKQINYVQDHRYGE